MYVPFRVHGHHSLLTGVDSPAVLVARAAALGLPALALADVDCISGLVDFLRATGADAGEQAGPRVRPIVAAELTDGPRPGRLIALVENETGYRNLCRLITARQVGAIGGISPLEPGEPFDLIELAVQHQAGLFLLADHPRLLQGLHARVPCERLFAALHPLDRSRDARPMRWARSSPTQESPLPLPKCPPPARPTPPALLIAVARAVGAATLAVPDVYQALPSGSSDQRLRTAIKHNALIEDLPAEWLATQPAHLPAASELRERFAGLPDLPGAWPAADALERTLHLAERCTYTPPLGGVLFPRIELAADQTPYSRLCELAFEGARRRFRPLRPEVLRRLDYELTTIEQLGFAPYFLLVERIARFARERDIPTVGRGSAADSLVAYCLGLTEADPLRYGLPFERFLNPDRRDRPDIDLDFCPRRRDEVLEHVYGLFGAHRTAMISTLNTFGPRAAFREAALAHGIPPAEIHPWSSRLPHHLPPPGEEGGSDPGPLVRALRATPEARDFPFEAPRFAAALKAAEGLLGIPRHFGLHPGGVVVAPGPLTDVVACQLAAKRHPGTEGVAEEEPVVVTQLDKDAVEALGLVKMDLLGNRALTTLAECRAILAEQGIEIDLDAIPEDDPATARTLREGRTLGCFQVESPGMRNLLQQLGASTMDDVIQAIALIRPGPAGSGMKDAYIRRCRGLEAATPPHPRLVDVLRETQGVMLYQEDVMQAAAHVAGMELAEADELRRALQKRQEGAIARLRERFLTGAADQGVDPDDARGVWDRIAGFASFAFCKAHAVTYGRMAYRTVWLKTHYPAAFLTAFLASETGYYPARVYIEEARRLGVPILAPDVNRSAETFRVERIGAQGSPALRVGLSQVRGLSRGTIATILRLRAEGEPFLSLPDFLQRTGAQTNEAEALIRCGAFDAFDRTRPELLWRLHLLKTPQRRPPSGARLDPARLAACRETPESRSDGSRADGTWSSGGRGAFTVPQLSPGEDALLFPAPEPERLVLPGLPDPDPRERGRVEFELLGLCVHQHPVTLLPCPADARRRAAEPPRPIPCAHLSRYGGGRVTLRGLPAATRQVRTDGGRLMRFLTLEDTSGLAEVVIFPPLYRRAGRYLAQAGVLCITGTVQEQFGAFTLNAERVW